MTAKLQIEDVTASYDGTPVLERLNFSMDSGDRVALLGDNGAGKSTLLKAVLGLVKSDTGHILFEKVPLEKLTTRRRLAMGLGYLPQRGGLFPNLTVEENILAAGSLLSGKRERQSRLMQTYDGFPFIAQNRNRPAGWLSSGEQQLVALAKIRMNQPKLLLLDEPSAGLSPKWHEAVLQALEKLLAEDSLVLMAEQNIDFALLATHRVCMMERGRIVLDEPAESFQQKTFLEKSHGKAFGQSNAGRSGKKHGTAHSSPHRRKKTE